MKEGLSCLSQSFGERKWKLETAPLPHPCLNSSHPSGHGWSHQLGSQSWAQSDGILRLRKPSEYDSNMKISNEKFPIEPAAKCSVAICNPARGKRPHPMNHACSLHCKTGKVWKTVDSTFLRAFVVQRLSWKIVQSWSVQLGQKNQLIPLFLHIFLSLANDLLYHLPRFPIPLAPVHRSRKFSAVFGTTSLKSSQTWGETRKGRKNMPTILIPHTFVKAMEATPQLLSSNPKFLQILPLTS